MANNNQINKISVENTIYQITPSIDGTFDGTSEDNMSPSSWTNVNILSSGETNGSIFTKISNMFKNIRFLYNRIIAINTVTLSESDWTLNSNTGYYEQTKTVSGITANSYPTATIVYPDTLTSIDDKVYIDGAASYLLNMVTSTNSIKFVAINKPFVDITIDLRGQ